MNITHKIYRFTLEKSYYKVFLLFFAIGYFITTLSGSIITLAQMETGYQPKLSSYNQFLHATILSPLLETAIFQQLTIRLLITFKIQIVHIIIISGIIFGLVHGFYGLIYLLTATAFGLLLSTCYITFMYRQQIPFWTTFILYALVNLFGVLKHL